MTSFSKYLAQQDDGSSNGKVKPGRKPFFRILLAIAGVPVLIIVISVLIGLAAL